MLLADTSYKAVYRQFLDSFESLKKSERILQFTENKLDKAVFFSKDRNSCILLILQKLPGDTTLFGYGRAVQGVKDNNNWRFSLSREYIIERDYLKLFKENTFENISLIARYYILTDGKAKMNGCEIDEDYWFEHER